jgi:ABC-type multidrug transport system fused ATPase/permease subunit
LSDHVKQLSLVDSSNNKRWFRTPFLFKISKYNIPEWHWILLGTIVSLTYGCSTPLYGLIFSNLYASFSESNVHEQERVTRNYAIIAVCIGLGTGIAQFLTSLSFAKSGEALTMRMRKLTFSAMLRQEMNYFDQESNSTGALVTRLSTDASALKVLLYFYLLIN